jgi:hypothetical protein
VAGTIFGVTSIPVTWRVNINPGQVGDDAVRGYQFAPGDRVILTPVDSGNQITWERMK